MSEEILQQVHDAQQQLRRAGILTTVTGEVALSYHGVDVAIHAIELCVPSNARTRSMNVLATSDIEYEVLPSIETPDFYHPYKSGAACFRIPSAAGGIELHLVTDAALGFVLDAQMIESGLEPNEAHAELKELCRGTNEATLLRIAWPSMAALLNGALALAAQNPSSDLEIIYLMQAERLVDANTIDEEWCSQHIADERCRALALQLLAAKQQRQVQSDWS